MQGVSFSSGHRDLVLRDFRRTSSSSVWSMNVLVVLRDSAMLKAHCRCLNPETTLSIFSLIPDVVGTDVIFLCTTIIILVLPRLELLWLLLMLMMTVRDNTDLFPC